MATLRKACRKLCISRRPPRKDRRREGSALGGYARGEGRRPIPGTRGPGASGGGRGVTLATLNKHMGRPEPPRPARMPSGCDAAECVIDGGGGNNWACPPDPAALPWRPPPPPPQRPPWPLAPLAASDEGCNDEGCIGNGLQRARPLEAWWYLDAGHWQGGGATTLEVGLGGVDSEAGGSRRQSLPSQRISTVGRGRGGWLWACRSACTGSSAAASAGAGGGEAGAATAAGAAAEPAAGAVAT
jgi:hypothetical protein